MSFKNLQKYSSEKGFTIVELLIVIVVIGILAAIVIVAYNGITQRANANAAKSNATSVKKVADAFNAQCPDATACASLSGFPTYANLSTYSGTTAASAKLPSGITINTTGPLTNGASDGKTLLYANKGTTGVCVGYWDASANAFAFVVGGDATGMTNVASPVCS